MRRMIAATNLATSKLSRKDRGAIMNTSPDGNCELVLPSGAVVLFSSLAEYHAVRAQFITDAQARDAAKSRQGRTVGQVRWIAAARQNGWI